MTQNNKTETQVSEIERMHIGWAQLPWPGYHGTCFGKHLIWHLVRNLGLVKTKEIYITAAPVVWHFKDLQ